MNGQPVSFVVACLMK